MMGLIEKKNHLPDKKLISKVTSNAILDFICAR